MHKGVVKDTPFFQKRDQVFVASMVPMLEPLMVKQGECVYRFGEYPHLGTVDTKTMSHLNFSVFSTDRQSKLCDW